MISVPDLTARVTGGDRRALARLITLVENGGPGARSALSMLFARTGQAHIVGVTGSPGSGKSTLVNGIARKIRQSSETVGIVAVDPTSPFSGGAVLGDRIRMRDLAGDAGIFIRSMASRGSLGGLARTTGDVVKVLDAAGFDIILIETVGAGQAEVDIAKTAHTTIVVQAPGMGDDIQAIKAGILEIADIFVVNKSDRPGADNAVRALQMMQRLGNAQTHSYRYHGRLIHRPEPSETEGESWEVPIIQAISTEGRGIPEVVAAVRSHRSYLEDTGEIGNRETIRVETEFELLLRETLLRTLLTRLSPDLIQSTLAKVIAREVDPYTAVDALIAAGTDDCW